MKPQLIFLFVLICFAQYSSEAQNWTVGVPVDTVHQAFVMSGFDSTECSVWEATITYPFSTVTGVNNLLYVVNSSPPNSLAEANHGTINSGDTIHFTQSHPTLTLYSQPGSTFFVQVKSLGTPQVANEQYICGGWWQWGAAGVCSMDMYLGFYSQCTINPATSILPALTENPVIRLTPQPIINKASVQFYLNEISLSVINMTGQEVFMKRNILQNEEIDFSFLPPGVYCFLFSSGSNQYSKIIMKI